MENKKELIIINGLPRCGNNLIFYSLYRAFSSKIINIPYLYSPNTYFTIRQNNIDSNKHLLFAHPIDITENKPLKSYILDKYKELYIISTERRDKLNTLLSYYIANDIFSDFNIDRKGVDSIEIDEETINNKINSTIYNINLKNIVIDKDKIEDYKYLYKKHIISISRNKILFNKYNINIKTLKLYFEDIIEEYESIIANIIEFINIENKYEVSTDMCRLDIDSEIIKTIKDMYYHDKQ